MEYDFSLAHAIAERELAPYRIFREAQAAGVRVGTFEEALQWKQRQEQNKTHAKPASEKKTSPT